jgi:hypothetical protein
MKRTIFYSWQSDLDATVTRNLIEDALNRAARNLKKDQDTAIEPVLDRDTSGIPGSPSISETIFAKILLCDVFVADVSIINSVTDERPTPNPNVLIELGFAGAHLGWDRILLVLNTAFASPEALPFDLRGRRVVSYELPPHTPDRDQAKTALLGRLEAALRAALGDSTGSTLHAGLTVPLWWGHWNVAEDGGARGGCLFIREVGPAGFWFDIYVFNGARTGHLTGFARLVGPDLAYARVTTGGSMKICELSFRRSLGDGKRKIIVNEEGDCTSFRGMGASFAATYFHARANLFDGGILDEIDLVKLYHISGRFYDTLSSCFQLLSE